MTYDSFINGRNALNNLYIVVRKADGKEMLRGANHSQVIGLIGDDTLLYEIYFY